MIHNLRPEYKLFKVEAVKWELPGELTVSKEILSQIMTSYFKAFLGYWYFETYEFYCKKQILIQFKGVHAFLLVHML